MKTPKLRVISSTRNSVQLTWSPEPAVLSSSGSSSSLLQRTPRQSRTSLTSEDRKVSRTSLASVETPTPTPSAARRSPRTPKESYDETTDAPQTPEQTKEWFTLQRKSRLQGWATIYWGYKNEVDISPLAPGEVHQFRLKTTTEEGESEWSDPLTTATKDDVVSAASLHRALDQGHMTSARKVLALRLQALEIPSKLGRTPLSVATARGDNSMSSMLLTCGADVNAQDAGSYRTPLMTAAFRGAPELLHVLKERDASWAMIDRFGQTALHFGAMNSQLTSINMAIKETPDVNVKDHFGWSPLMQAVTLSGSLEAIKCLLDNGSDVNTHDNRGQTVLMQAVLSGRQDVVELLLERGAEVETENVYGHTAYDMATNSTYKEIQNVVHLLEFQNSSTKEVDAILIARPKQSVQIPN